MIDPLEQFERRYNVSTFTQGFRCKKCGATCELSDFDLMTAQRIQINHKCNVIESPKLSIPPSTEKAGK